MEIDEAKVKQDFVKTVGEYFILLNQELLKAGHIDGNMNNSRIRSLGMNIADIANIAMGTQRLDFKQFEEVAIHRIFTSSLHEITTIVLQSQCTETKERVLKVLEEIEVKLTKSMHNWAGENVKKAVGLRLEKLEEVYEEKYGEKIKY